MKPVFDRTLIPVYAEIWPARAARKPAGKEETETVDLLPAGLISRADEAAEAFAVNLGMWVPRETSEPLLDAFQKLHEETTAGFQAASAHAQQLLNDEIRRLKAALEKTRYLLAKAQEELDGCRDAAQTASAELAKRLSQAHEANEALQSLEAASRAAAAQASRDAEAAARETERVRATLALQQKALRV